MVVEIGIKDFEDLVRLLEEEDCMKLVEETGYLGKRDEEVEWVEESEHL